MLKIHHWKVPAPNFDQPKEGNLMKIEVTTRHFSAQKDIRNYAESGLNTLIKHSDRITISRMIISRENNGYTTEINLSLPKHLLNVKDTSGNVTKSIDGAVKKMVSRINKITDKWKNHH